MVTAQSTTTTCMSSHTPRPLHLVTNSSSSTPTNHAFASPSPPSSFRQPKRFSMMAATTYSTSSPTASTSETSAETKAARRKSSIGYFAPDSTDSPRRGSIKRRNSLGALNESLARAGGRVKSWTRPGDRSSTLSTSSARTGADSVPGTPGRERPPLTLMEKNADLLRFIAQKESKCLELRSQLAVHEAELAELKRKWQKIVNKGVERGHPSVHSVSNPDTGSIVLDGIKEGVQGVSRLLSAGFTSQTAPSSPSLSLHSPKPKPRPPSLIHKSHFAKESNSSISTFTTSRSANTTARFSQSSMSSFGEEPSGSLEEAESRSSDEGAGREDSHDYDETHVQILMVRDTGATPTMSPNPEFHQQKHQQRHKQKCKDNRTSASFSPVAAGTSVIGDFEGQTWTSEVQSTTTKAHRRKSREVTPRLDFEHIDFTTLSPSVLLSPPSQPHSNSTSPGASPRLVASPNPSCTEPSTSTNGLKSSSTPSLAPMASIPGFGLAAGVTAVSPPMSSWMDSMGKKLGQLQRSTTFTKNQKRASLLLSDVSNSIVNVLAPSTTSDSSAHSTSSGTATAEMNGMKSTASNLIVPPASPNPSSSGSLLDDEDEDETAKLGSASVLQPVASTSSSVSASTMRKAEPTSQKKKEDFDDEEWNCFRFALLDDL
ncbi:hypothetical protein NP233_g2443 [Leucocoprinus birnbaumii]|uniref:Uncharacterized protein n=1 Tax=Leucocoprinus birnbaumii TaxID=56174 RepID=A0AAD5VY88_9AGAR|nr:hypothetical protein NP233_g2443 [Leucocoprinus birnbaumii]